MVAALLILPGSSFFTSSALEPQSPNDPREIPRASLTILYTAGTDGHLEPLLREGEMRGGFARRALLLADTSVARPGSRLIVEAGGLFDSSFVHEARRARLQLESLAAMGYDVVHLTAHDLALGPKAIRKAFDGLAIAQVATNVRPRRGSWPAVRALRREVAGVDVIITGVVSPQAAPRAYKATDPAAAIARELREHRGRSVARAPLLVVLSDLTAPENEALVRALPEIALIISTRADSSVALGRTTVFPRTEGGCAAGKIQFEGGRYGRVDGALLPLGDDRGEDAEVRARLTAYYGAIATLSPPVTPLDREALERGYHYAGAVTCARCHAPSADHWSAGPHAHAYETLVEARRHELPECVRCHATGVGHPDGFTTDRTRPYFAGVQCESCHGAGGVHSRLPARGTIRRQVEAQVCLGCHTPSQSPGYHADPAGYQARVVHAEAAATTPAAFAEAARAAPSSVEHESHDERERRLERARVELYIMSFCPYGGTAAEELAGLRDSLAQAITVDVHYIVRSTEIVLPTAGRGAAPAHPTATPRALASADSAACVDEGGVASGAASVASTASEGLARGFTSLHGPEEVVENLRQIVIAERYPQRLLTYVARRAADPEHDWRALAADLGMDAAAIEARLPEARPRLLADAARIRSLGITASPTVHVNGAPIASGGGLGLERAICSAVLEPPARCAALPECEHDADCRAPGMEGKCERPGRADARCVFSPAPEVTLHVLNDPSCGQCSPLDVVSGALDLFANLEVVAHDVSRGGGKDWIDAFDIQSVPAFAFAGATPSASFARLEKLLIPGKGGSLLDPAVSRGPLYFRRVALPRTVDFFIDATGEETLVFLRSLAEVARSAEGGAALDAATLTFHPVLEQGPPAASGAMRLVQRGTEAYLMPESELPQLKSRLGVEDLAEARRQACVARLGGRRILSYMLDRAEHGEVGAGDWRERCRRIGVDAAQVARCAAGGEADLDLAAGLGLADSLGIRPPAALAGNRLRFDGLGPWNMGPFVRAVADSLPAR